MYLFKTFRFWRLAFSQLFVSFSFSFILGTGRTFGALIGIDGTSLQFLMLLQSAALIDYVIYTVFSFLLYSFIKNGNYELIQLKKDFRVNY